jgi:hypothetical protein
MAPPAKQQVRISIGGVFRDTAIVLTLTLIGGLIIGVSGGLHSSSAIAVSNLLLGTIGFIISGSLARGHRWRHLVLVGLGVWLFGLANVALLGISIAQWFASAFAVAIMTGVGGSLSYLFSPK